MSQPFKLTDDNFKKAVRLSKTNMTMTEIGRELGTTKNAVLGKMHRHKLSTPSVYALKNINISVFEPY